MVYRLPVFETTAGVFDIELPENIVIIGGKSSTGKSYLYQNLIEYADLDRSMKKDTIFTKIYGVNFSSIAMLTVDWLKSMSGVIVVVDNASMLMERPEVLQYIDKDYQNQYILFGRGDFGLHTSLFGRGILTQCSDGVFRVQYRISRGAKVVN